MKWIFRALAFVKVLPEMLLKCPFGKVLELLLLLLQPFSPVCVSLKSIKMLQIKLKVSTFFSILSAKQLASLSVEPSSTALLWLCSWPWPKTGSQFGFRFWFSSGSWSSCWALDSAWFACATFSNDNYKSFAHTFSTYIPLARNYFLISLLICGIFRVFWFK